MSTRTLSRQGRINRCAKYFRAKLKCDLAESMRLANNCNRFVGNESTPEKWAEAFKSILTQEQAQRRRSKFK